MSGMSRRDLIRASAGAAAVAVPIGSFGAGALAAGAGPPAAGVESPDDVALDVTGPVMFCVRDVRTGEASILYGTDEVIVRDRQLINRIVRAATTRRAV